MFRLVRREFIALFLHRTTVRLGIAATGTFTVIFFYQFFGESVIGAICAYTAIFLGTALLTPFGAAMLSRTGVRGSLLLAMPLLTLAALSLVLANTYEPTSLYALLAVLASISGTLVYRALYWVPYQVGISMSLTPGSEGRQVAVFTSLADVVVAGMPLLGGFLLAYTSFQVLFAVGAGLFALSAVPLFFIENRYECFRWTAREAFAQLFNPRMRPLVYATMGDGIQFGILAVVWPLLIYFLLNGEYQTIGAVTTLALIAAILLRTLVGKHMDRIRGSTLMLRWGAFFSATGWVLKAFVATPFHIVMVDTYHMLGQAVYRTSIDIFTYEQAADNGSYIDEYTALKEIAINTGRALGLLVVAALVATFGVATGFTLGILFAGLMSITPILLSEQQRFC